MSDSNGKVIELLAIERNHETSYLRINLSFTETVELLWETDSATVEHLKSVSEFNGIHKYRLSLHTTWDVNQQHDTGLITRTYRDQSDRFPFACSVQFRSQLESIKHIRHMNDLHTMPFLSMNSSAPDEPETTRIEEVQDVASSNRRRYHLPLRRVSTAIMSLIFVILLSSFNYSHPSKIHIHPAATATAEVETTEFLAENQNTVIPKTVHKAVQEEEEEKKSAVVPSTIPYLEIDDFITFSIPKGYVALTFDDGPSKHSVDIMNILKKYKVGGTFFFVGTNVEKHPDYVRAIHTHGYSIGSHSMSHAKLPDLSYQEQEDEFSRAATLIEDITKEKLVLFRPPYGAFDEQTEALGQHQDNKLVLWNRDPEDWLTRDEDKIFDYVQHIEASGSIILLHESQAVVDALPRIIKHLRDQNLKIVSLQ